MCLMSKHFFPKISFKKIKIYKIVIISNNGNIRTPYRNEKLMNRAKGMFFFPEIHYGAYFIYEGMIHAFTNKRRAFTAKQSIIKGREIPDKNVKIIKGYIPPFTRYYIGEFGEICAKRMRYETI